MRVFVVVLCLTVKTSSTVEVGILYPLGAEALVTVSIQRSKSPVLMPGEKVAVAVVPAKPAANGSLGLMLIW